MSGQVVPTTTNKYCALKIRGDLKNEFDQLTDAEKQAVLDDMFGGSSNRQIPALLHDNDSNMNDSSTTMTTTNEDDDNFVESMEIEEDDRDGDNDDNNNNRGGDSNEYDISAEMLDELYAAIEELPPEKTALLWHAWSQQEEECQGGRSLIVDGEDDLALFLRAENYNPKMAARRLVEYWEMRYDIFGPEDAFKPMTLDGALKDVAEEIKTKPNLTRILPDDDHGRTVICLDRSDLRFQGFDYMVLMKITWFVIHRALQRRSTQDNGIVFLVINPSSDYSNLPPKRWFKLQATCITRCLPLKFRCAHICISSLLASLLLPIVILFWPKKEQLRIQIHNTMFYSKSAIIDALQNFGLQRHNLPKSIGGSYNKQPLWIHECDRVLKERRMSTETVDRKSSKYGYV